MLRNRSSQAKTEIQKPPLTPSGFILKSINDLATMLENRSSTPANRLDLMRHQQILANSFEMLWRDVQSGRVSVDSIALLRALRDIAKFDLSDLLQAPDLDL
ncbi:MAG: hypothetical protein ACFFD6_01395, partial [Candidatus Thorarchaeota archaeon]